MTIAHNNNNKNTPALTTPVAVPRKSRGFAGIEPGRLHGARISMEVGNDPHDQVREETQNMDGRQLRLWLKRGDNRQRYDAYLEQRKQQ